MPSRPAVRLISALVACGAIAAVLIAYRNGAPRDPAGSGPGAAAITPAADTPTSSSGSDPASRSAADAIRPRAFDPRWEADRAAASRPSEPRGSIVLHVIWGDDKTPAGGVGVQVIERGTRSGLAKQGGFQTGADGSVRLDGVIAGPVEILADRGGRTSVDLGASAREEVTLEIPAGRAVSGTVVDLDDEPVAGAEIWIWANGSRREGALVARSDAAGGFSIRSVGERFELGARHRLHAPSSSVLVPKAESGEALTVALRVGGPPATLAGTVTRSDGLPVSGARVQVEPDFGAGSAPAVTATSGEWGEYHADGLQAGSNIVVVRVAGQIAWSRTIYVAPGDRTTLAIVIPRGVDVAGSVRAPDGKPVSGVRIRASGADDVCTWDATTATDGSFTLEGLRPGTIRIAAELQDDPETRVRAELEAEDGAVVRWDPVMNPGPRIFGVARDENGRPLSGWTIEARSDGPGPDLNLVHTDAAGKFELRRCTAGTTYQLAARATIFEPPVATLDGVVPGDELRVVRVNFAALGTLRGRILGVDGAPEAAEIELRNATAWPFVATSDARTGAFSVGPFAPGRYRVLVRRSPVGLQDLGEHEIATGAALDLGEIRLVPTGTLVVDLPDQVPEGTAIIIMSKLALDGGERRLGSVGVTPEELAQPFALPPGSYSIEIQTNQPSESERPNAQTFEVSSCKETRIRLSLEPR